MIAPGSTTLCQASRNRAVPGRGVASRSTSPKASTVAGTRSIASRARSRRLTLTFDISQLPRPRNWAMAGASNGYRAALGSRRFTPGLISSLPGTAGLPPSISFSTSCLEQRRGSRKSRLTFVGLEPLVAHPSYSADGSPTDRSWPGADRRMLTCGAAPQKQDSVLASQASARARRNALSRALRVSVAAAVNSERASASRPARNRKSPLAAGNGA